MRRARWLALGAAVLLLGGLWPVRRTLRASTARPALPHATGLGRVGGSVLTGALRPLLAPYLWLRADALYARRRMGELRAVYGALIALYAGNDRAREFLGWDLAYNRKGDGVDAAEAWSWAGEGLDVLFATPSASALIARWFLQQDGQDALLLERYAGPQWRSEIVLRAYARHWCLEKTGRALRRFEAAVHFATGGDTFLEQATRASALRQLAVEEWVTRGRSSHAGEAVAAFRDLAARYPKSGSTEAARALEAIAKRDLAALGKSPDYATAVSLWGMAAAEPKKAGALALARAALALLPRASPDPFPEERAILTAWRNHMEHPDTPEPPRLAQGLPR